jgi:tRNA threonylcarbamoyladenosine modification (KEOPS) complex Cgi121 subunit
MQNKPNFPDTQMNISTVKTKHYEQRTMNNELKNKPNQSQFLSAISVAGQRHKMLLIFAPLEVLANLCWKKLLFRANTVIKS